jgi:hypothetical protein
MAYLLFYVIPLVVMPCLGLAASGWGAWRLYDGLLDRRWMRAGVGAVALVIGLGLLFLVFDYLNHPFSPTD